MCILCCYDYAPPTRAKTDLELIVKSKKESIIKYKQFSCDHKLLYMQTLDEEEKVPFFETTTGMLAKTLGLSLISGIAFGAGGHIFQKIISKTSPVALAEGVDGVIQFPKNKVMNG